MIANYFTPINENQIPHNDDYKPYTMGNIVTRYYNRFPDITSHHCAIFGIKEERGSEQNFGTAEGMDFIRKELYQLYAPQEGIKIVDLGDIEAGETCKDSYFAIQEVCKYLIENRVIPIILGGGHDNTIGQYMAYKDFGHLIDLVYIDNKLNIDQNSSTVNATNHILDIINANPLFLFNLENVGFQRHLNNALEAQAMEQLLFDIHNLGSIKQDLKTFEPIARGADMVSFDIASVAIADAPGNKHASTNGLSAIEACQMARYIGISDKVSSFGIYEYNPTFDIRNQTAALVAQMIWYFIDGYYPFSHQFFPLS